MNEGRLPREEGMVEIADRISREISMVALQERVINDVFAGLRATPSRIDRIVTVGMPGAVKLFAEDNPAVAAFTITDPEDIFTRRPRTRISYVYNEAPPQDEFPMPIGPHIPIIVEEMITTEADDRDTLTMYHAGRDNEGVLHRDEATRTELDREQWVRPMLVRRIVRGLLRIHPPR